MSFRVISSIDNVCPVKEGTDNRGRKLICFCVSKPDYHRLFSSTTSSSANSKSCVIKEIVTVDRAIGSESTEQGHRGSRRFRLVQVVFVERRSSEAKKGANIFPQ